CAACLLSRRRTDESGNRVAPGQALCAGRAARLGRRGRSRAGRYDAAARGRSHAAWFLRRDLIMPMIRETIVTTADAAGKVHIAPIGITVEGDDWIIAPFRPSTTLDNLRAVPFAVANYTDDVRVSAGCLTGRHDWPTTAGQVVPVPRLAGALAHAELAVD